MKMMIRENERGFLFKKAKFVKLLEPGVYRMGRGVEIRKVKLSDELTVHFDDAQIAKFRDNPGFAAQTVSIEVGDAQVMLHFTDGTYTESLGRGKYTFWNSIAKHTFETYPITAPKVPDSIPRYICERLCEEQRIIAVRVPEYKKGMLYFDDKLTEVLEPGVYYFWNTDTKVTTVMADTRQQLLNITGQEILTKDKVNVRLNFVCSYRITDFISIFREVQDYATQFYLMVQMTMREYVAACTLDELLAQREQIAAAVTEKLREKAAAMYIEVAETGIRDIILPGEVREIMNTVLLAEKRAQANVITRREEVASTRSLLNTAKLMDENKTLYKLKELEYLEKICENVGNISVSGGDLLAHLRAIVGSEDA